MSLRRSIPLAPLAGLLLAALSLPLRAQESGPTEALAGRVAAWLEAAHRHGRFDGAAGLVRDGEVVWKGAFGTASPTWEQPNGTEVRYRIASLTKQFTAAAILRLAERQRLALDDPLTERLPWYRRDTGSRITIRQLLNHTSGLPSYTDDPGFFEGGAERRSWGVQEFVERFCSGDLAFDPGSDFLYSNGGYHVLGAVVEETTGKPLHHALRELVFEPAGLEHTELDRPGLILHRRAEGLDRVVDDLVAARPIDMTVPYAAGGVVSTVDDLLRWDRVLAGDGLLSAESRRTLFHPARKSYACGWIVQEVPVGPAGPKKTIQVHGGGIYGFTSLMLRVPEGDCAIVLLANVSDVRLQPLAQGLLALLHGAEVPEPGPRPDLEALRRILDSGLDEAVSWYRSSRAADPRSVPTTEGLLAVAGNLLELGRAASAASVFRLVTRLSADDGKAWAGLGNALFASGRPQDAAAAFRRAVEIEPDNDVARKMLERLGADEGEEAGSERG